MELQHSFQAPAFARALNIIYGLPEGLSKGGVEEFAGNEFQLVHVVTTAWESLGILVHRGEVDLQLIDDFFSGSIIVSWRKVAPSGYLVTQGGL